MIRKSMSVFLCIIFLSSALLCGCSGENAAAGNSPADTPVAASPPAKASETAKAAASASGSASKESSSSTKSGTSSKSSKSTDAKKSAKTRSNKPNVLTPEASGTDVRQNDFAIIDVSNASEGYFMTQYLGSNPKVKLRVITPNELEYFYLLSGLNVYETFPLPCGDGTYELQILENISGDRYAVAFSTSVEVTITDKFKPFLYPNQYVNFDKDRQAVKLGKELAEGLTSDLEVIESVYHYITTKITYDDEKAATVVYGYLPDIDDTLRTGTGICFDYASVMSAILRSQGIPTKLEVGYSGEAYHAWISTFVKDVGWIDKIIEFDGKEWTLMDPTLAANNSNAAVEKYIGDGSNYVVKFSY